MITEQNSNDRPTDLTELQPKCVVFSWEIEFNLSRMLCSLGLWAPRGGLLVLCSSLSGGLVGLLVGRSVGRALVARHVRSVGLQ